MGIKFKGIVITNRTTTLFSTFSMILSILKNLIQIKLR